MTMRKTERTIEMNCTPRGTIQLPPSKSLSHRALICGALAGEGTTLKNLKSNGEDVAATLACLEEMGLRYRYQGRELAVIRGIEGALNEGVRNAVAERVSNAPAEMTVNTTRDDASGAEEGILDCNESGSTLRFFIPLALLSGDPVTMTGRERLLQRPLKGYLDALGVNGAEWQLEDQHLRLQGPLRPGIYEMPGDVSSQFVSGLLMALPLLDGSSEIRLTTELESKPYVDMTIDVMEHFGVCVESIGTRGFRISGNQSYKPSSYEIEGDYSAGAYFLVAGALGCDVKCIGLEEDSRQGDREILDFIRRCGGSITRDENGDLQVMPGSLQAITADISQCPDLAPPLAVLLCFCEGESRIEGASRLRMKESDRLSSITQALNALGAKITEGADHLLIKGIDELDGGVVDPHNDHRIAMAGALASLKSRGKVTILDSNCVNKSYPDFWRDFCGEEKEGKQ